MQKGGSTIATATILLIRHAAHGHVGHTLSGRMPDIPLTAEGKDQAGALARRLAADPPDIIQSSPILRARETAGAIAGHCDRQVELADALEEVDFGEWTGRSFDELEGDPQWQWWNSRRSQASAPGGESMRAAQERSFAHLRAMAASHGGETLAMITHCDIIRAMVAAILGLSLDNILRLEVGPASVTRVAAGEWGACLTGLNERIA